MSNVPFFEEPEVVVPPKHAPTPPPQLPEKQGMNVVLRGLAPLAEHLTMANSHLSSVSAESHLRGYENARANADADKSITEQILLDSALLAFGQATQAVADSAGKPAELRNVWSQVATRFMGEARKCLLALHEIRKPVTTKQVTVVQQQNLSAGHQQVGCMVDSTVAIAMAPSATGKPPATLLETSVTQALEHTLPVVLPVLRETNPDEKLVATSAPKPGTTLDQRSAVAPHVAT